MILGVRGRTELFGWHLLGETELFGTSWGNLLVGALGWWRITVPLDVDYRQAATIAFPRGI